MINSLFSFLRVSVCNRCPNAYASKSFFKERGLLLFVAILGFGPAVFLSASALAEGASTPYPLTICVVSGDPLGEMESPVIHQEQGEEVRFCCKDCVGEFQKDPQKYLGRLHQAKEKQGVSTQKKEGKQEGKASPTSTPSLPVSTQKAS
jgi:YHS domain-containing protein